jgi:Flp pilus assembly protein TadG
MLLKRRSGPGSRRHGQILVKFALVLTVLLGMVGLVIDGGLLMVSHRQAQNAADAAALAAAMELFNGYSQSVAQQAATTYVEQYNSHSSATVTVNFGTNISAQAAPGHRKPGYVEVFVTLPVRTYFIQVLGINPNQSVTARAVAGFEPLTTGEGVMVLDPRGTSNGLSVQGGGLLKVNADIVVNNLGKGLQVANSISGNVQWPNPYNYNQYAVATGNNGRIYAQNMEVLGGVDTIQNIYNIADYPNTPALGQGTPPFPLESGLGVGFFRPDPLDQLPIPVPSSLTNFGAVKVTTGNTVSFTPGIYQDINIQGGGIANFAPGVYVLSPSKPNQGLTINGGATVNGTGVLFYVTGSDYLTSNTPGFYDIQDGGVDINLNTMTLPAWPAGENANINFASVSINGMGSNINLTGMDMPGQGSTLYKNILFFQRRRNTNTFSVNAAAGLNGTIYAKWANFSLSGSGNFNGPFVVGTLSVAGQATVTVTGGQSFGLVNKVFLVE